MSDRQDEIVSLLRSISHKLVDELGPAPIVPYVPPGPVIDLSPLRFTNAGNDVATVEFSDTHNAQPNFKIRFSENGNWEVWDYSVVTLQPGEWIELCGTNENSITNYTSIDGEGSAFVMTGTVSASGNIMSIAYEDLNANNTLIIPQGDTEHGYFGYIFGECTSLISAPALPATTLASSCYDRMFGYCTNLTAAPALPASTLVVRCYSTMFYGCSNLITAPELPATTLAESCYSEMFVGCSSLTTAPELPATELTDECYYSMFTNCTSLIIAPELPSTTLSSSCYEYMFSYCTSLTAIKCLATDISASDCTSNWLFGVSESGTFTKAANMNSWTTGVSGIPSGWTVQDA